MFFFVVACVNKCSSVPSEAIAAHVKLVSVTLTADAVLSRAALEHFRAVLQESSIYSLPRSFGGESRPAVLSLESALARRLVEGVPSATLTLDVEDEGDLRMQSSDPDERVYFRVVHANPSKQVVPARPAAAGRRLKAHEMAVAVVRPSATSASESVEVDVDLGHVSSDSLAVLSCLGSDPHWLRLHFFAHETAKSVSYYLLDWDYSEYPEKKLISHVLDSFLVQGAFPDGGGYYTCDEPGMGDVMGRLKADGVIVEVQAPGLSHTSWQLSPAGFSRTKISSGISEGSTFMEPRKHLPLCDQTEYELLATLLDDGWQWKRLPNASAARLALPPFDLASGSDEPKIFYTSLACHKEYLQCLLSGPELLEQGIACVPHGLKKNIYVDLLAGKPYAPAPKRMRMLADVELRAIALEDRNDGDGGEAGEDDLDFGDGLEGGSLEEQLEGILDNEGDEDLGIPVPPKLPGHPPSPAHAGGSSSSSSGPSSSAPPPLPAPPLPAPPLPPADLALRHVRASKGEPWGPFRIYWTKGGWEAICPYHRGTETATKCKKFHVVKGDTTEHIDSVRLWIKAWCIAGARPEIDRKWKHLKYDVTPDDMSLPMFLEIQLTHLVAPPWDAVVSDEILDLLEEPLVAEAVVGVEAVADGPGGPVAASSRSSSTSSSSSSSRCSSSSS
jgi:hypothetical protein